MKQAIPAIAFAIALSWACNDHSPTGADDVVPHDSQSVASPIPPASRSSVPVVGSTEPTSAAGGCEVIDIRRRDIRVNVEGLEVHLFVPASSSLGVNPYVDVWTPEINGVKLGRGPANEWFTVTLPDYGTYRLQLAVEVDLDGVVQCDRHHFEVTATPPPPPPPPPCVGRECDPPPPPPCGKECEPPPGCDGEDSLSEDNCPPPPPPEFTCADYTGWLCHATGTQHQNQLWFQGIPPGHCKHLEFWHSPGQGPVDTLGFCGVS